MSGGSRRRGCAGGRRGGTNTPEPVPEPFAFNGSYANDYLSWQEEPVKMRVNGSLNSFAFVNCRSKYVLMPMLIEY